MRKAQRKPAKLPGERPIKAFPRQSVKALPHRAPAHAGAMNFPSAFARKMDAAASQKFCGCAAKNPSVRACGIAFRYTNCAQREKLRAMAASLRCRQCRQCRYLPSRSCIHGGKNLPFGSVQPRKALGKSMSKECALYGNWFRNLRLGAMRNLRFGHLR